MKWQGTAVPLRQQQSSTELAASSPDQASLMSGTRNAGSDDNRDSSSDGVDELQAVRETARKDTANIRLWRTALTAALVLTAVAVTWSTYRFLVDEQDDSFVNAFDQFSKTVGDAAIEQQRALRVGFKGLADAITAHAQSTDRTWPYVTTPFFRTHADLFLRQSKTEQVSCFHRVEYPQLQNWSQYTIDNHMAMVESAHMEENGNLDDLQPVGFHEHITLASPEGFVQDVQREYYYASWEYAPAVYSLGFINFNVFSTPDYARLSTALFALKNQTLASNVRSYTVVGVSFTQEEHEAMHAELSDSSTEHPHTFFFQPVHERVGDYNSKIVAVLAVGSAWDASWRGLLPDNVRGLIAVIRNDCNQSYTYSIDGKDAIFMGDGDLHDSTYDSYKRVINLALHDHPDFSTTPGHCQYSMHLYPSKVFQKPYDKSVPEVFAVVVSCAFLFVVVLFFMYDLFVYRRNEKLVQNAARSNAIVSSLFPKNVRDRLITESQTTNSNRNPSKQISSLKSFLSGDVEHSAMDKRPLADLFLETTVMFADIAGFTAWSSVREPSQVFTFLETVFSSFDQIAKARRVFKVETVGDCYVAATGIPEPRNDHAVVMVRFARDILTRVHVVTKELEITLGPDTADLSLRIGIHSGPVTAGVLRGERARFQLFGDTMNTASRIENSGQVGRIHVSTECAECIRICGKGHWLVKREETVQAKGKGVIQTYWISSGFDRQDHESNTSMSDSSPDVPDVAPINEQNDTAVASTDDRLSSDGLDERGLRLVDWNVEMLLHLIKQIVARRETTSVHSKAKFGKQSSHGLPSVIITRPGHRNRVNRSSPPSVVDIGATFNPLNEVTEIISLPEFDATVAKQQADPDEVDIDPAVVRQLRDLVTSIASMYRNNSFHNFEHASHVTMSVLKLLARIVAPSELDVADANNAERRHGQANTIEPGSLDDPIPDTMAATLHDHTYGITSDPLTQFACAFSALIHDVDHSGVPNAQLVKEKARIAQIYDNRSVAEQNSLVLSWELFMADEFAELRNCICASTAELKRLRQLMVNAVMATDIVDKELKQLRNDQWAKAFDEGVSETFGVPPECDVPEVNANGAVFSSSRGVDKQRLRDDVNRKATIVIEHLIQASDVAHTMQHWHVYRKWNERFFRECYAAYKAGRSEQDPIENWYRGELGFFDFYIIPLAKKLKECGVFGKSSDEYLNYALANRREWEARGQEMVAEMTARMGVGEIS